MIAFDFAQLRLIGLQQAIAGAATQLDVSSPAAQLLRVSAVHRDSIGVHDGILEHPAQILPRLLHELQAQDTSSRSATGSPPNTMLTARCG